MYYLRIYSSEKDGSIKAKQSTTSTGITTPHGRG